MTGALARTTRDVRWVGNRVQGWLVDVGLGFFEERSTASRVKHMLLLRHLPVFAMKTSIGMTARRVYHLDGYAGPGMYDDASPGSPLIAADGAAFLGRTSSQVRSTAHCDLVGIYIEEDPTSAARLRASWRQSAAGTGT